MGTIVVCVLNVDLGAIFSDFCLSNAIYCMGQNTNRLQRVSVYLRVSAHGTRGRISRKRLTIEPRRFQWDNNRKWHMANRLVTWSMTSRGLERSSSWPQYLWGPLSRKWLEIQTRLQTYNRAPTGNGTRGIKWSLDWWRHVTGRVNVMPDIFGCWMEMF